MDFVLDIVSMPYIFNVVNRFLRGRCSFCSKRLWFRNRRLLRCSHSMHVHCFEFTRKYLNCCPRCDAYMFSWNKIGDACCICLDGMNDEITIKYLRCGHALHVECLRALIVHGQTKCPICRINLIPFFLVPPHRE